MSGYNRKVVSHVYFMMANEEIDYKLTAEQLRTGKPLFGKDGAWAPMLERILNAALEGEMDALLSEKSHALYMCGLN